MFKVCDFICNADTFSTKACDKTFKIQSVAINCNTKNTQLVKQNWNSDKDLIIIKAHTGPIEKNINYHSNVFMNIMAITVIIRLMIGSSY